MRFLRSVAGIVGSLCLASASALAAQSVENRSVVIYGVLADEPVFDSRTKNFRAKGNIALLTSEGFLTGEVLSSQDSGQLVTLEGNVIVVRKAEIVHASRLVLDRRNSEFMIFDAEIVSDPIMNSKDAVDANLLGISVEEVVFEKERQKRISDVEKELRSLRDSYVRARNLEAMSRATDASGPGSFVLRKKYADSLRKLMIARHEPNEIFEELPLETRKRLEARRSASRDFLAAHPEFLASNQSLSGVSGYARMRAEQIYRNPEGTFTYTNASVTPCRCGGDSSPILGLSTYSGSVDVGGYAYMRGAALDVLDVPVLYSPYFIYPVKRQRESGFLRPYFFMSRQNRVLGVPFFLTLGEHADATFTLNDYANRGTRYDLETRFQLSPESRFETYGEYISDRKFEKLSSDSQYILRSKIDALKKSGSPDPIAVEDLEDRLVSPTHKRWYVRGGWNLPVTGWASAKASGEMVSDPGYFSDFATDDDSTPGLSLLKPAQTSKRFLLHEASVEYYGHDSVISGRVQGVRDIFSLRSTDTIYRVPRFEVSWLPRTYFGLPGSVDGFASWERIRRNARRSFVDLARSIEISPGTTDVRKDGIRQPDEPYIDGDRANGRANILIPLPVNNYVNASLGASVVGTEYRFSSVPGDEEHKGSQNYVTYNADASMPLFSEFSFFSPAERTLLARLRHDFVPSVSFTNIPNVWRSQRFPFENQLFYAEDAVYPIREFDFGIRSTWTLAREGFADVGESVRRIPEAIDPGVGVESALERAATKRKQELESSSTGRYRFSTVRESGPVFDGWAEEELGEYFSAVRQVEFGRDYLWTDAETYRRVQKWTAVPLSLGFSSGYNLDAARTEREKRERNNIQEGVSLARVPAWGDLQLSATVSPEPLLPVSLSYSGTWSVLWDRWIKHATTLGAHWTTVYSASTSYSQAITPSDLSTTIDRVWGYILTYQPRSWLSFSHTWSKQLKWIDGMVIRDPAYNNSVFDVSNAQTITISGLQDCMDIVMKRQKDFKQKEGQALWSIGLNMNLFGQKTGPIEVGEPVNSWMQKRYAQNK